MLLILVKNNLKLMLRNKWVPMIMILIPLVTIALLSNVFKDMMDTTHKVEEFQVGYRINNNNAYSSLLPDLKSVCKDNGVELMEFPEGDITELINRKAVTAFVDITNDTYTIYKSSDSKIEASVTESIFSSFFYQVNANMTMLTYSLKHGNQAIGTNNTGTETENSNIGAEKGNSNTGVDHSNSKLTSEKLDTEPVPSSTDYYGIIYIVYGTWCGMITLVSVISSERKGSVLKRMRVSHISKFSYYIGKFIPGSLAIFIEVCVTWIISILLYKIHWGNIGGSILIIFLTSMAATAFGIVLFQLFRSVAVSIVIGFIIIWIAGFFGGTFQTYIYSTLPQALMNTSPLYYTDRTLVEFSTKGFSDYAGTSIIYLILIIIVCGILGTSLMSRKLEEQ